jgi:hypothetical protein
LSLENAAVGFCVTRNERAIRTAAGVALIAGGAVLLVLPGPGIATIAAGVALIPGGARKVARARAYIEPRVARVVKELGAFRAARRSSR